MRQLSTIHPVTAVLVILFGTACVQQEFAGSSRKVETPTPANDHSEDSTRDSDGGAPRDGEDGGKNGDSSDQGDGKDDGNLNGDGDEGDDLDGLQVEDDRVTNNPQACTADNGKIVFSGQECPEHFAGFISDDGSGTRLGCCALPATDILDPNSPAAPRGTSCGQDEIAVGAQGEGFICRKINTAKYRLGPPATVCYWGKGSAGSNGARDCNDIIAQLQGLIGLTGDKDGCIAQPYGAIITQKSGKDCGDQKASVLLYSDGSPVQMFP